MHLPTGITGFRMAREAPLLTVDGAAFQSTTYAAARAIAADIMAVALAANTIRNFHLAVLRTQAHTLSILCNRIHPMIAFALGGYESATGAFIDVPELAIIFAQTGQFRVLKQAELDRYPEPKLLSELGGAEITQIRAWKPQHISDIVFNEWD
jgi:hypothetical protein